MSCKVLYILTESGIGGAQKYVNDLAANLDKNLFEARVLYGGGDIKWLSNKIHPWFLFLNDWLAVFELVKIFRRERPDIIHLNSSKTGVIGSLAAFIYKLNKSINQTINKPRVIFTAHGWVFNPNNYISWPVRWFYILVHKLAALFQDKIITVSKYDRKIALQYKIAPEHKLTAIHNGIDPNISFLDKKTARRELAKRFTTYNLQLTTGAPWIGSIGRLVKEKNYQTLIEAASKVPNAYFFIIGEGPELGNLQRITNNLQLKERFFIIKPNGYDFKFLKAFDAFVMSSIKEGLPYILLEAMAAELPIITTETGGISEVIKHKESGYLVPLKKPEAIAESLKKIVSDSNFARNLKIAASKRLKQSFNADKMLKQTSEIYTGQSTA